MTYLQFLEIAAHWSAILTALVAVTVSVYLWCDRRNKRLNLERHLKSEKKKGRDKGQRGLVHLSRHLAMTEAEILHAAFSSKRISATARVNKETNVAEELLFEYI